MKKIKFSSFDIGMPAVLAGAGILTLIICLIVLLPGEKPPQENRALEDAVTRMDARMTELELQLGGSMEATEAAPASGEALSALGMQLQSIAAQVSEIQKKIDYIDRRQGNLEQRVAALRESESRSEEAPKRAVKSSPKKERAAKPATKSAAAKTGKYHVVSAGETRYGIARQYGLSVKQLDRLNGFSVDTIIQPGQKILVQK